MLSFSLNTKEPPKPKVYPVSQVVVAKKQVEFENNTELLQYILAHHYKAGDLLKWGSTGPITNLAELQSLTIIEGYVDEVTQLDYDTNGNPKVFKMITHYTPPSSNAWERVDSGLSLVKLTDQEIEVVRQHAKFSSILEAREKASS